MAKGLAAFAVGLGSGYLTAQQRGRDQERQDRQDAQNSELHGLRMDEANAAKNLRMGLADAVKPATLNESAPTLAMADGTKTAYDSADTAGSDFRQLRRNDEATGQQTLARATLADGVNLPGETVAAAPTPGIALNGKAFDGDITQARAAQTSYNTPQAQAQRIGMAYSANGKPVEAMQYQKSVEDMEAARKKRFADLQKEGALRTATAMLSGDAENVFRTYNAQGDKKLKEVPTVKVVPRDLPGFGIVQDKIYSGILIDKDGNETPLTMGSHDANMALYDYKDMMEMQSKGLSRVDDAKYKAGMLGAALTNADSSRINAEASKTRAERPAGVGGSRDPEIAKTKNEIDAARNKRIDIQARIANLPKQVDARLITRDAAKAELAALNAQQKQYDKIIDAAESADAAQPGLGNPLPTATKVPAQVQQARDGDRLGILNAELKKATEQGNQADIDSLNREIGRLKPGLADQNTPSKPVAKAPTKVPSTGEVRGGYRFKGGNPADKKNWEQI